MAGVRVPACYRAEETGEGTVLVLEDLSAWRPGADPAAAARVLSGLHREWEGRAGSRWPWLRPVGAAADLVQDLFDRTWPRLAARGDLTPPVAALGARLVGRVIEAESTVGRAGPATLVHGDAATRNMRTGPGGEVALLDWEDVSAAPGILDLAWLLVSSVAPAAWDEVIAAYGPARELADVLPAVIAQGLLSLHDTPAGSAEASAWISRLEAAGTRLGTAWPTWPAEVTRERVARWVAAYECAWRTPGTETLAQIFTPDATYRQGPYEEPVIGLPAIRRMWEEERQGPGEVFSMTSDIVAVDGATAVVRVGVGYGHPVRQEYRDLWVMRFADDGLCSSFEEWPFWPERPDAGGP